MCIYFLLGSEVSGHGSGSAGSDPDVGLRSVQMCSRRFWVCVLAGGVNFDL